MKKIISSFVVSLIVVFFSTHTNAQVTNLKVNGSSSPFTMTSGDNISWTYNLSTGGTSVVEIWVDVNTNSIIDQDTDVRMFQFIITDGNSFGINGPGDMDGATNGAISVGPFATGLAPASYIMKVTENNVGLMITGTVSHLASPAYTIAGKVTPPTGFSAENIIVDMNRSDQIPGVMFWDALTDASGNFTVEINSDTAGPWTLEISTDQNPFPSSIITPISYEFFVSANIIEKDFVVTKADAKVVGIVKKEGGTLVPFHQVTLFYNSVNSGSIYFDVNTDVNGLFQIGLPMSHLTGQQWTLQTSIRSSSSSDTTENYMDARVTLNLINVGDSIYKNLTLYAADTTITGTVSFQTGAPFGWNNINIAQILLIASTDSTESYVHNNTTTGNYTLRVSNKIAAYRLFGTNLPQGYDPITLQNIAPGATNVNFSYTLTEVKERKSGIPESFSLSQNYPNPFNPTTNINYDIPNSSFVNITIYNELGQKIISLVNKEQKAGKYVVSFNASNLSSGVYFYQLKANDFVQIKKMILLK